jgi:hypothetical protein
MQFWDKQHLLSKTLGGPAHMVKGDIVNDIAFDMGDVIWDFVAVYPPQADQPSLTGAPVFKVIDEVRTQLSRTAVSNHSLPVMAR